MARYKEGHRVAGVSAEARDRARAVPAGNCTRERWMTSGTVLQRNGGGRMMDEPCVQGDWQGVCLCCVIREIDVQERASVPCLFMRRYTQACTDRYIQYMCKQTQSTQMSNIPNSIKIQSISAIQSV